MIRAVIDTSVLVSAVIRQQGALGFVIKYLMDGIYRYVYSLPLIEELVNVIVRPKIYAKYGLTVEDVETLLLLLQWRGKLVHPDQKVDICRDPKDNKILEAALAGKLDMIVTSDSDLLVSGKLEDIPILSPAQFLTKL
jgi:putative PIN family toxin of toxin-antitoxin system